ncbi:MAG TPA: hypothetical protein VFI62_01740, partial [Burkholderiales bacterium]|nr:hypothetical protein [Burkholderiales bacterium]
AQSVQGRDPLCKSVAAGGLAFDHVSCDVRRSMPIALKKLHAWRKVDDVGLDDRYDQLLVWPHHPDQLRWPASRPSALHADRLQRVLTWNVFRTLELLPPAFWLRRLQARLQSAQALEAAPQIVRVELWRALALPPAQRLIESDRAEPVADILIETEHAVWTLMVMDNDDMSWHAGDACGSDPIARLIDAGSWLAGTRDYHFGLIVFDPERAPIAASLVQRYGRSRKSLSLRSGPRAGAKSNVRGIGLARWTDLAAILQDCEHARVLADIERALARNALTWLAGVGIVPVTERSI